MNGHCLTNEQILAFSTALFQAERSQATVEKYLRSVREFFRYLDGRPVTKDTVMAWKKHLQREENYSPSTVNASLAALNYLFNFLGWTDCRTHYIEDPAPSVPGDRSRVGPSRLRKADRRRPRLGPGADRPRHGDYLRHGHPGGRGTVHHGGGRPGGQRHHLIEGQNSHDFAAGKAV